jgi:MarR family transcriptional regulator, organic hydroperoxide resistance regulator
MRIAKRASNSMAAEAQHPRHFDSDERLSYLTREAMRAYGRSMQIRLIDHSVSIGHWLFLRALWAHDGMTQRELSEYVGLMGSTTFTALNALEKLGYVKRAKKQGNKKKVHVYLTPQGRKLQVVLTPLAVELNATAVRGIAPEDVEVTKRSLVRIIENLIKDEADLLTKERRVPSTRDLSQLIARTAGRRRRRNKTAPAVLDAAGGIGR